MLRLDSQRWKWEVARAGVSRLLLLHRAVVGGLLLGRRPACQTLFMNQHHSCLIADNSLLMKLEVMLAEGFGAFGLALPGGGGCAELPSVDMATLLHDAHKSGLEGTRAVLLAGMWRRAL